MWYQIKREIIVSKDKVSLLTAKTFPVSHKVQYHTLICISFVSLQRMTFLNW